MGLLVRDTNEGGLGIKQVSFCILKAEELLRFSAKSKKYENEDHKT